MKYFEKIYKFVRQREGGYANVADDAGGETYAGISRVNFPNDEIWFWLDKLKEVVGVSHNQVFPELEHFVRRFYESLYKKYRIDELNDESVAMAIFDYIVHSGPTAVKRIQRLVGVSADGVIGPVTIQAINAAIVINKNKLVSDILADREKLFSEIIQRKPSQEKFAAGWANRLSALRSLITDNASPGRVAGIVVVFVLLLTLISLK
jgi:lysozyme family protein